MTSTASSSLDQRQGRIARSLIPVAGLRRDEAWVQPSAMKVRRPPKGLEATPAGRGVSATMTVMGDRMNDDDPDDFGSHDEDEEALPLLSSVSFEGLDWTEFEDFCHDLLIELGFVNVDWRKGTPKQASPSDRGRDLVAQLERRDVDGHVYYETWFVDCKHYKAGVPPEALAGLTTWAQTERPAVALVIASGFLSNAAKDWLSQYETNNHPPFRLRYWERPQLSDMISDNMDLAWKHGVSLSTLRPVADIIAAENEMYEKVWYGRKPQAGSDRARSLDPEIENRMRAIMTGVEAKYGEEELMRHVESDFDWGMLSGKLSALRWVLGEDWDFLDT